MRIALLTTTLESGHCGVGDFTRRIAGDLAASGHEVLALAFRDPHASRRLEDTAAGLRTLRLPRHAWSRAAQGEARAALVGFAPDGVSLQVSPYGLGHHGLLLACLPWFERLLGGLPLHIMYHELWIGGTLDEPWRQVLEGRLQRYLLQRFHRRLGARAASCSSALAQAMLQEIGIEASIAPVPSNIPVGPGAAVAGVPPAPAGTLRLALFGGIPREWDWCGSLGPLCQAIADSGRRAELVQLGRAGGHGEALWTDILAARELSADRRTVGPTDPRTLSGWLQSAHAGLSLSPLEALGKSGVAGAYREHGLPILGLRPPLRLRPIQGRTEWPPPAGAHRADAALLELIRSGGWPAPAPVPAPERAAGLVSVLGRPETWAARPIDPSTATLKALEP